MFSRLLPIALFRGQWKSISDYRGEKPIADRAVRLVLILVPLSVGLLASFGSLASPGSLLSGVALLSAGFLAAFGQISSLRLKLTERASEFELSERIRRDSLDETASHLLVASYMSAVTAALLVLAMNFGVNCDGAIVGPWAGIVAAPGAFVLLLFLITIPRLYVAYTTINSVRRELNGTVK